MIRTNSLSPWIATTAAPSFAAEPATVYRPSDRAPRRLAKEHLPSQTQKHADVLEYKDVWNLDDRRHGQPTGNLNERHFVLLAARDRRVCLAAVTLRILPHGPNSHAAELPKTRAITCCHPFRCERSGASRRLTVLRWAIRMLSPFARARARRAMTHMWNS